jgi:quercetin dioxygenase-like cupin family protein
MSLPHAAIRTSEPFISTSKDSPAYWLLDILWVVHATGEQTQGSYSLIEQWMPQAAFPPPHVHPYEDESFWVIEGEMTVEVGGKTLVLGPGSLGHVPRNTVHSFKVTSKAVCHILNYYTPAGFEQCHHRQRQARRAEGDAASRIGPPRFAPGRPVLQQLLGRPRQSAVGAPEVRPCGLLVG